MGIEFMLCLLMIIPPIVVSHCDTLDGPVVMTARLALEKGDVTPVLKWVKKENEEEIHTAFKKTMAVRGMGNDAKELADMYFFETLVRLHRAGEGAPYEGLKPAGTDLGPAVVESDKALENGSADKLVKILTDAVIKGIHARFTHAIETKKHADQSIEAGREFVEAYVMFVHYAERLYLDAVSDVAHHVEAKETGAKHESEIKHDH